MCDLGMPGCIRLDVDYGMVDRGGSITSQMMVTVRVKSFYSVGSMLGRRGALDPVLRVVLP